MAEQGASSSGSDESAARHVTGSEEFDEMLERNDRVLVDFYADWCGPCHMVAPTIEELAGEHSSPVLKVDIEAHQELAHKYEVRSIPTFIVFDNGRIDERLVGVQDKASLTDALD